jgi:hypothetical protein
MLLRLIVLLHMGLGCYLLQKYFRRNPPEFNKKYIRHARRISLALYRLVALCWGQSWGSCGWI